MRSKISPTINSPNKAGDLDSLSAACGLNTLTEVGYSAKRKQGVTDINVPEEVPTQADHCILGGVQTYVTLEGAVLVAAVGRGRAAGPRTRVFGGRGGARGWRGGCGGHLNVDPLHKKVQVA